MENQNNIGEIESHVEYSKFPCEDLQKEVKVSKNVREDEPTDPTQGSDFSDIDDEIEQRYFDEEANDEFIEPLADPSPEPKKKAMMTPHPNKGVLQRDRLVKNNLLGKLSQKADSKNEIIEEEEQPRRAMKTPHPSKGVLNRANKAEHGSVLDRVLPRSKDFSDEVNDKAEAVKESATQANDGLFAKGKQFLSHIIGSDSSKTNSESTVTDESKSNTGLLSKIKGEFIHLANTLGARKNDMSAPSDLKTLSIEEKQSTSFIDKAQEKPKKSARFVDEDKHVQFAPGAQVKQFHSQEPITDSRFKIMEDDHGLSERLE